METQTINVQFRITDKEFDDELNLTAGEYQAEVVKVDTTDPVQYQVRNLKNDSAVEHVEADQLILIRKNDETCTWLEAHHNSCSPTVQVIGQAIDSAFNS